MRAASLGRAMVSLARAAPAHLARARSGATATTSSLTRAASHHGARHQSGWSPQRDDDPTPRPPHRATMGRRSSPPVVARSSTTDSTSTSAIIGDPVTLPPPGDVHLWIMDPTDAADPALCRDYRARCLPASERDALESEAANMTATMKGRASKPRLVGAGDATSSSSSDGDGGAWRRLRFSVSHTNRLVVLAVTSAPGIEPPTSGMKPCGSATPLASPGWGADAPGAAAFEVGVDCEDELRRTSAAADKLAGRWLSPLEHDALKAIGDDTARAASFMRTWTLKESYVKALGTGIAAHPFGWFDVSFWNGEVRGSSPVGSEGGRITLTERSGTSDAERRAWAATERRWRMALLKPRGDDSLLIAVCAHATVDEDEDEDEVREGLGSCGMNVRVRWTVPVVGDVAEGARPPPELIARTEGFGALE